MSVVIRGGFFAGIVIRDFASTSMVFATDPSRVLEDSRYLICLFQWLITYFKASTTILSIYTAARWSTANTKKSARTEQK
jgi:hypothetical protein